MTKVRLFVAAIVAATGLITMVGAPTAGAIRVNVRVPGPFPGNFPPIGPGELLGVCLQTSPQPATCVII
ncbi:MAG TPA: hypothetical protein VFB78_11300 [Acidimicrobiales bacterium]|nr:hypothetical protein [Acidimicrobiales bacterium]